MSFIGISVNQLEKYFQIKQFIQFYFFNYNEDIDNEASLLFCYFEESNELLDKFIKDNGLTVKSSDDMNCHAIFQYKIKKTKINKLKKFDKLYNMIFDFNNEYDKDNIKIICVRVFNLNKEYVVQLESNRSNDDDCLSLRDNFYNKFMKEITENYEIDNNSTNVEIDNYIYEYVYINKRMLIEFID